MGTVNSDFSVIRHLTDAIRHAMLLYGDSVLENPNLIEILRDHGAFNGYDCTDEIIRILIDNGSIPTLLSLSRKNDEDILDGVDKEVCNIKYMCSFHEKDIRTVLLSMVKGMNMNLDISQFKSQDSYISDSIEIDPDDLIEPPSCPITPRNKHKDNQEATQFSFSDLNDIPLKSDFPLKEEEDKVSKSKRHKRCVKACVAIFASVLLIAVGIYAAMNMNHQVPIAEAEATTELPSDRLYIEVLEDIQSNNGHISAEGRAKLEKALKEYPDDYWFNFLKEKIR